MPAEVPRSRRAALYARVSTLDQEPENQLVELRQYAEARGWTVHEYVDEGVSGSKERRPALDRLLNDARRRRFDVLVCWRLDRLGRNLRHLILLLDDRQALGVAFVSLSEGLLPRIVVTDDRGRYVLPDLPRGIYKPLFITLPPAATEIALVMASPGFAAAAEISTAMRTNPPTILPLAPNSSAHAV